jgi:CHAD domain-containing protein
MPAGPRASIAPHRIRQSLLTEIDHAIEGLSRAELPDETIHEVRRGLKRARATLRLMRGAIGPDAYHHHNVLLRDAARPLTPLRDSIILIRTLKGLANGQSGADAFRADLRRHLRLEHASARAHLSAADIKKLTATLAAARQGLAELPDELLDRGALRAGLERAYRSARRAYRRARKRASDPNLHEWRKQTKYYLHQLELVAALDKDRFARSRKRAARLADRLGDDHDLAVLSEKILQHAHSANSPSRNPAVEELLRRLAQRRKRLQRKAARLGEPLYSSRARRIGRKVGRKAGRKVGRKVGRDLSACDPPAP